MRDVIIYRFEDNFGSGMYSSSDGDVPPELHFGDHCPGPRTDSLLMNQLAYKMLGDTGTKEHRYGFGTKTQLKKWMLNDDIAGIVSCRFNLNMYSVPADKVAVGRTQAIFDHHSAVFVGTTHISKL